MTIIQNLVNSAIGIINGFIGVLNRLPGVSISVADRLTFGTTAQLENEAATQARNRALADYQREVRQNISDRHALREQMQADARAATADRLAEIEALRAAQNYDIESEVSNAWEVNPNMFYDNDGLETLGRDVGDIAGNTGKMANISGENLKYWRDIAERDNINRFTTAKVNVRIAGINNTINYETDLDYIVEYITDGVEESLETMAERTNNYV